MTNDWAIDIQTGINNCTEISYVPVDCVEMKATIELYHIYAEKFNNATIKDEANWYADICAVLLNRIREMERRLHNELEQEG